MGAANEVVSSGTCAGGPVCLPDCLHIYLPTYLASFINRGIPPVKHSRQHNRAAVGEPGFSRR
ncbi:hypothetical protein ALC57_10755 [Trachymyrmex cornetzi]|uniref:Uncharacterized protein n=1 Tax=Trachymyrmex cornetzi TaxID=471704 RepID=A0A151J3K1_9HYME|nr:hypothetical protein ALC57_10755 [Trachymyrmex cornetzi]